MDAILNIFKNLGVDYTIVHQFVIFFVFYLILSPLLFKKLQSILELRDKKTFQLEQEAEEKMEKANELVEQYKDKIGNAFAETQVTMNSGKEAVQAEEFKKIKDVEEKLESELQEKRSHFQQEISQKKQDIFATADELANQLVDKLS